MKYSFNLQLYVHNNSIYKTQELYGPVKQASPQKAQKNIIFHLIKNQGDFNHKTEEINHNIFPTIRPSRS